MQVYFTRYYSMNPHFLPYCPWLLRERRGRLLFGVAPAARLLTRVAMPQLVGAGNEGVPQCRNRWGGAVGRQPSAAEKHPSNGPGLFGRGGSSAAFWRGLSRRVGWGAVRHAKRASPPVGVAGGGSRAQRTSTAPAHGWKPVFAFPGFSSPLPTTRTPSCLTSPCTRR